MTPPAGCTAVHKAHFELGLRFPLHPFFEVLLRSYNLALCNLTPNSVAAMVAFVAICDLLGVVPTPTLWRNLFKLTPVTASPYGYGWWSFQIRKGLKVAWDLSTHVKVFRGEFVFVYYGREWGVPRIPVLTEPNLSLNWDVPKMEMDEAVVAFYLRADRMKVNGNWENVS